ncbi:hypothetical protein Y900_027675 [Mycolicibacterium aromaticivorans JS19b1 = JCM 16368]|uniref:Uncharacterized protein n=1 Tax=Mycolicibacterium aromaticivorans JS19b1 = JCM 16368 TaxID=1440774 RepID=A0A064CBL5_9MYCO|nr:hypothetical protein [Mycolicibacterium aromaticivorans]KDE97071.1 hypothetical protein Y900_027675 [Mycolicibacterium aromaticivorans JS19b1 = JCM 16368]
MYQLTIATDEGARTTSHANPAQAGRALLDYAIQADLYLHGDHRTSDQLCSATNPAVITLVRLDAGGGPPRCVGTATITATVTVAPTTNNLTGAAAS